MPGRLLWPCLLAFAACRPAPPSAPPAAPPVVPVATPVRRDVTEYVEYTGRLDAVESVGIRARATGYLIQAPFKEGATVKKGDLLFEIDPRPYQAQLDQSEAQVKVAEANALLARATLARTQRLGRTDAASAQELEQAKAAADAADAQVRAAKSTAEVYRLNLGFTKVTSPIDGRVSRTYFTVGNLVSQDQTLLTTVVSLDPVYAYFDMDERTVLRVREAINAGKIKADENGTGLAVRMALEGQEGFPLAGTINFINNVVNPSTGTMALRGVFANPQPAKGQRLLSPGMFVRIRLPIGDPAPGLLVVDRAVASDQGLKYVYVVGPDNKVKYQRVKTGPLEDDGLRLVTEGLKPDDRIAVGAIQQLRPGVQIDPEAAAMPTPGAPAKGENAPPEPKGKGDGTPAEPKKKGDVTDEPKAKGKG